MDGIWIFLAAVALIGASCIFTWRVKRQVRDFSRNVFGTDSLAEGFQRQEEELRETPKSVSGMTSIYGPQIEKDFPELSVAELMRRSENQLKEMLEAMECRDVSRMREASWELKREVNLRIEDLREQEIREEFQKVQIHKTAVSGYRKTAGYCMITVQSAVEYVYSRKSPVPEKVKQPKRTQTRYNMEWIYVQDPEKIPEYSTAVTVNCPNCGAVIKNLGNKFCEYCGSDVKLVNMRVWSLNHIEQCR